MNARFRSLSTAVLVFAALLLTACEVTISPGQPAPEPDITRSATMDPSTPYQVSVPADDPLLVRVTLDSAAQNDEAIYFEVDGGGDAELVLFTTSGSVLASSSSADVFRQGTAAVASAGVPVAVTPQITTVGTCLGPCIIDDADRSAFLLEVRNTSGFQQTFDLYLYTQAYGDEFEPDNDSESGATNLGGSAASTNNGAIEDIGDRDWWAIREDGVLAFDITASADPALDLRMTLFDTGGNPVATLAPGDEESVFTGETVVVFEDGDNAAAVSARSQYFLDIR